MLHYLSVTRGNTTLFRNCARIVSKLKLHNKIADSLDTTFQNKVSMSVQRPTLCSADTDGLLHGSCSCRCGVPRLAIRLKRHLDGSATAVTSLSAAVYMAVVLNCPVQVPISALQNRKKHLLFLFFFTTLSSRNFRLPLRCRWYLRSCKMLHSICWQFVTDVSGRHIGPTLEAPSSPRAPGLSWRPKHVPRNVPVQRIPQSCQLPRLSRGWCLNVCMWSIGGMTLTGANTSTRRCTPSSANLSTVNTTRTGRQWHLPWHVRHGR